MKLRSTGCLAILFTGLLLLSSCAGKGRAPSMDLWTTWKEVDQLMQVDFPDAVPIVLVHGWNGSEILTWPSPQRLMQLEDRLQRDIYYFTYRTGLLANRFPPIEIIEEEFERFLASFQKVDVVAHSMGGLIVRQYLLHHPVHPIRRIVFLATPHFGTHAAHLLAEIATASPFGNQQGEEMQPGSDFLWRLNQAHMAELANVQVLNVFVPSSTLTKGDVVVPPRSAYLPDAINFAVSGTHHTVAERMIEVPEILAFLQEGKLPKGAPPPEGKDVWLRIADKAAHRYLTLSPTNVKLLDAKGIPHNGRVDLCCKSRSSMDDDGASTIVVHDVQPGDRLQIILRKRKPIQEVDLTAYLRQPDPIVMDVIPLEGSSAHSQAGHAP